MIHDYCAELEDVLIRPLHKYDIEILRKWRNCSDNNKYLRNVEHITKEAQAKWFGEYLKDENVCFFSIDYKRQRTIGTLALYDFENETCQIGKLMIGDEHARGHNVSERAFLMAMGIAFFDMDIKEIYLSVHEENLPARKVYEKLGFQKIGHHPFEKGGIEIEMSMNIERFRNLDGINRVMFYKENGM